MGNLTPLAVCGTYTLLRFRKSQMVVQFLGALEYIWYVVEEERRTRFGPTVVASVGRQTVVVPAANDINQPCGG